MTTMINRTIYGYTLRAEEKHNAVVVQASFDDPVQQLTLEVGGFPKDLTRTEYVVTVTSPGVPESSMNWSYSTGLKTCFRYLPPANQSRLSIVPTLLLTEPAQKFEFRIIGHAAPRAPVVHFLRTLAVTSPAVPRLEARMLFWA
ncbi:hypothetical protein [Kocuria salsicia]|uniref:hypothetical protein n=1 Tax=Kocuria salsicia TaxID=664639 RepID=UPI00119F1E23|nr:hypothetical protein [Kocuria salsicia]